MKSLTQTIQFSCAICSSVRRDIVLLMLHLPSKVFLLTETGKKHKIDCAFRKGLLFSSQLYFRKHGQCSLWSVHKGFLPVFAVRSESVRDAVGEARGQSRLQVV